MQVVVYYTVLPLFYAISILPDFLLYRLSDFFYYIFYYLVGYRKKVSYENLKRSFPEKSEKELLTIQKQHYRYFCDLILESFKPLTASASNIKKRCYYKNPEVVNTLFKEGKNIVMISGHYCNWELCGSAIQLTLESQVYGLYHPLHNPYFNGLINKIRERFGMIMRPAKEGFKHEIGKGKWKEPHLIVFLSDQVAAPHRAYWTEFLNQETPVYWGAEVVARQYNYPVVFLHAKRIKRGYYELEYQLIEANPAKTKEGEITEKHSRLLEKNIKNDPPYWLWTHRKWKYQRPENIKMHNGYNGAFEHL